MYWVVRVEMEGFSLGRRIENKCGMRSSGTGELLLRDVQVPAENLLGAEGEELRAL